MFSIQQLLFCSHLCRSLGDRIRISTYALQFIVRELGFAVRAAVLAEHEAADDTQGEEENGQEDTQRREIVLHPAQLKQ